MRTGSPFARFRFELEQSHVYYLPRQMRQRLEEERPTYLIGTRGTGKTTLLMAMSYRERLNNKSLRRQLLDKPFEDSYIGVYFKLPDTMIRAFEAWLRDSDDSAYEQVMGLYIDLITLELIAEAIGDLLAEGVLKTSPSRESAALVPTIKDYADFPVFAQFMPSPDDATARGLWRGLRRLRRYLEQYATRRLDPSDLAGKVPMQRAGALVNDFAPRMRLMCSEDDAPQWRFYVCMDEGEALEERQQRLINTLVRLAKAPVYPIVSFVRAPLETDFIRADRITIADRATLLLDDLSDGEFRDLVEGVATVRVQEMLKSTNRFDIDRVLGVSSLDDLLFAIIKTSESAEAKKLLASAKRIPQRTTAKGAAPPIIEAYISGKLGHHDSAESPDAWQRRRDASAHRRRRIAAAYLSICHDLNVAPRYASAQIVLQLCDLCVRDFIWQMHEIFLQRNRPLESFLSSKVPDSEQDVAVKRASNNKLRSAVTALLEAPEPGLRLVTALGEITAAAQRTSKDLRHLKTPERGIFTIVRSRAEPETGQIGWPLIREAVEQGYLRFAAGTSARRWRFRVHTSLAPRFGFSYRGAYHPVAVAAADLDALCYAHDQDAYEAVLESVVNRVQGTTRVRAVPQLELRLK